MSQNGFRGLRDTTSRFLPPPLVALASITLGSLLEYHFPTPIMSYLVSWSTRILGVLVIASAAILLIYSIREFHKLGTTLRPWRYTATLVTSGPFRYSRNPIYLAVVLIQVGVGLLCSSVWIAALAVLTLWIIGRTQVCSEERKLCQRFGEEYEAYRKQTRRWF